MRSEEEIRQMLIRASEVKYGDKDAASINQYNQVYATLSWVMDITDKEPI